MIFRTLAAKMTAAALTAVIAAAGVSGFAPTNATAGEPSLGNVAWVYANAQLANGDRAFGDIAALGFEMPKREVTITAPSPETEVSCNAVGFSGAHVGVLNSNGRPLLLIVESIDADCNAVAFMSWGSATNKNTDLDSPWREVTSKVTGDRVLARSKRNVPVGKWRTAMIKGGVLVFPATSRNSAKFTANGSDLKISWGGTGSLTSVMFGDIKLQETEAPENPLTYAGR